jgi:LPPG:FO 2-phospho-L-lactate transferase
MIVVLAGGVGGGKFARGIVEVLAPADVAIVVNTGDDFRHLGLSISPDLDSVMYAVADLNDTQRGWGLADESWNFMRALERLEAPTWFQLGDADLATHVLRTDFLRLGKTLSAATRELCDRLGIRHAILPMSDLPVATKIISDDGELDFQEYFVARRCEPAVRAVVFAGADVAVPSPGFATALECATAVVIAPSNPYVSIGPILALSGVRTMLQARSIPVIAVCPIVGGNAVKGPLAKMLAEAGADVSPLGVADWYGDLVDGWIVDDVDHSYAEALRLRGRRVRVCGTLMHDTAAKIALARDTVEFAQLLVSCR